MVHPLARIVGRSKMTIAGIFPGPAPSFLHVRHGPMVRRRPWHSNGELGRFGRLQLEVPSIEVGCVGVDGVVVC